MHPDRFGSYVVQEQIATGHLTEIYRALQQPLGRQVALKALKPSLSPSSPFAVALEREARVLSLLQHQNIPRLLDFVHTEQAMVLVLEYVDGFTLRQLLEQSKKIDVTASVAIALELTRALAHAHDRGVLHCAVRPSNVLLAKTGHVLLGDFSSAQAENLPSSPEPVEPENTLGMPTYMSPEQILGEPVDARSDLFLLGVVLYEMLSGARPFEDLDQRRVAHAIRHDEPPSLESRVPEAPRALAQIVTRCLRKAPSDRFATARELGTALEEVYGSMTNLPRSHVVALALARARLIERPPPLEQDRPEMLGTSPQAPSMVPALRMMLLMLGLIVLGGAGIRLAFRSEIQEQTSAGQGPLELVPVDSGFLRVLADPWAYVIIDGQLVETTPVARPIPLSPGVHHVTFKHPNAPDERRIVRIAPGASVLLDVTMRVKMPPKVDAGAAPAPSSSTP